LKSPVLAWTLIGVGAASGVASGITLGLRENRAKRWNDEAECVPANGNTRQERCGSLKSEADTFQTIGITTAIAGVALAGTGIALLLIGDNERPGSGPADTASNSGSWKLTSCNAGLMSIACSGSF